MFHVQNLEPTTLNTEPNQNTNREVRTLNAERYFVNTSRIENHPSRPWTHRAASSAPVAKPRRSRAVWVSSMVSDAESNPIVWVAGILPARVDETSIGRLKPA